MMLSILRDEYRENPKLTKSDVFDDKFSIHGSTAADEG